MTTIKTSGVRNSSGIFSKGRSIPKRTSSLIHRAALGAGVAVATIIVAKSADAALVFDNMTGAGTTTPSLTATSSTPNTFMGDGYTLTPGTTDITGFDLFPVNLTGSNYSNMELTIFVWGAVNTGAVNASAPAFSNLLGEYTLTSTGTFTTGYFYPFTSASPGVTPGITLTTPLVIPSNTVGITLNYQGSNDGITYTSANNLTSIISYGAGAAPTVGSDVFNGYYRNASSETNGNFVSSLRSLGQTNQSLGIRIYGDVTPVPEPASVALASVSGLALLRRRRRI